MSPSALFHRFAARPRGERIALLVLGALLLTGAALRGWALLAVRPALLGYSDTHSYIYMASDVVEGHLFEGGGFPIGYPAFLALLREIAAKPALVPFVQHALGIGSALLLYAACRRAGLATWAAVVPAGVVLLFGTGILVEQAILSETLFSFGVALLAWLTMRGLDSRSLLWPLGIGVVAGLLPIVRYAGFSLLPAIVLGAALVAGPGVRRRLAWAAIALLAAVAVTGGYRALETHEGRGGAAEASWPLYARAAGFADCTKFRPPAGTRGLCETTPASQRTNTGDDYLYSPDKSPALEVAPQGGVITTIPPSWIQEWTLAALKGQPVDYVWAVGRDSYRWIDPRKTHPGWGQDWEGFVVQLIDGADPKAPVQPIDYRPFYPNPGVALNRGAIDALRAYERATRLQGPVTVLLFGLAVAGPFLLSGRLRRASAVFVLLTLAIAIGPVMMLFWQARYGVPVAGPLSAAAAFGAYGLAVRVVAWRTGRARTAPAAGTPT